MSPCEGSSLYINEKYGADSADFIIFIIETEFGFAVGCSVGSADGNVAGCAGWCEVLDLMFVMIISLVKAIVLYCS